MKTRFQKLSKSIYLNICGSMLPNLLPAKVVWMPSFCCIPKRYLQNCVYIYLVPLLLNRIGYLMAYVDVLFLTSVFVEDE